MKEIVLTSATQSIIVVLNHSKDQEAMKIISDHFGWLSGDRKRSICNIYLFIPCWNQGSRPERRTQLIKLGYKGLPRRMDHRVTVKIRHDMTHNINSRSIAGRDQQPTRRSCKEYENK